MASNRSQQVVQTVDPTEPVTLLRVTRRRYEAASREASSLRLATNA